MKICWATSFRPFGISKNNDHIQKSFLASINNLDSVDVKLILTQFGENKVYDSVVNLHNSVKYIDNPSYKNITGKKYSQSEILLNGFKEYVSGEYDLFIWSTCDFIFRENFIKNIVEYTRNEEEFISCCMPQNFINSSGGINALSFHYGIDIFVIKLNKNNREKLLSDTCFCENYNWGIYEHYISSLSEFLSVKHINFYKVANILKFENDRVAFNENSNIQKKQWLNNKEYLINYLKKNNLPLLYANGSMIYLFYKNTRLTDFNFSLLLKTFSLIIKSLRSIVLKVKL
jgi:choline kinase